MARIKFAFEESTPAWNGTIHASVVIGFLTYIFAAASVITGSIIIRREMQSFRKFYKSQKASDEQRRKAKETAAKRPILAQQEEIKLYMSGYLDEAARVSEIREEVGQTPATVKLPTGERVMSPAVTAVPDLITKSMYSGKSRRNRKDMMQTSNSMPLMAPVTEHEGEGLSPLAAQANSSICQATTASSVVTVDSDDSRQDSDSLSQPMSRHPSSHRKRLTAFLTIQKPTVPHDDEIQNGSKPPQNGRPPLRKQPSNAHTSTKPSDREQQQTERPARKHSIETYAKKIVAFLRITGPSPKQSDQFELSQSLNEGTSKDPLQEFAVPSRGPFEAAGPQYSGQQSKISGSGKSFSRLGFRRASMREKRKTTDEMVQDPNFRSHSMPENESEYRQKSREEYRLNAKLETKRRAREQKQKRVEVRRKKRVEESIRSREMKKMSEEQGITSKDQHPPEIVPKNE